MSTETETTSDQWCNCQNLTTWHPRGDTTSCTPSPELVMGTNSQGDKDVIVVAHFRSGHSVTWEREVRTGVMPKMPRGKRDAESARTLAANLDRYAADLRAAANWADDHADELNGYEGKPDA